MRWTDLRLRSCPHLISRLRRQLPLIGEATGVRTPKASPLRGGGSTKPRRRGRRKYAATSQALRASIPTPFVPSGHFPLIGGIGPWKGSLFLQLFPLLPAENRPGGRRSGKTGRPVRTSARSTRTFCRPRNKNRETVHIAAGSALVGGYFV